MLVYVAAPLAEGHDSDKRNNACDCDLCPPADRDDLGHIIYQHPYF